jgi:acetylglutamate kinase
MSKPTLKIVKIGGNIINDTSQLAVFLEDFAKLKGNKILVHGGGKKASEIGRAMGIIPKMIDGRRITDASTLEIVTMVYAGLINKNVVAQLQANSCNAIGVSGTDGNMIQAIKRPVKEIDYGYAGDVEKVNAAQLKMIIEAGLVPVFCPITHDKKGLLLNTNADTIAAEIAVGMSETFEVELNYVFEADGVLENVSDKTSVIDTINAAYYQKLIANGTISDGMLPKMHNCFDALKRGVFEVRIGGVALIRNNTTIYTTLII